jgi:hypothetical protein
MADAQLHAFFDRLFPHGFAGGDVIAEIAPDDWERPPLHACFHPSAAQRYEEAMQLHRNIEQLRNARVLSDSNVQETESVSSSQTLEQIRKI